MLKTIEGRLVHLMVAVIDGHSHRQILMKLIQVRRGQTNALE